MENNLLKIGRISMGVAWMLGSAAVFIFKDSATGAGFMVAAFILMALLNWIDYELAIYYLKMKNKN